MRVEDLADTDCRGAVVSIGNFDGIHLAHRRILQSVVALAKGYGAEPALITFFPHARKYLKMNVPLLVTSPDERNELLEETGIERLVLLEEETLSLEADGFVERVLVERLAVLHVVMGYNHRFGRDRAGDPAYLSALVTDHSFGVTIVPPFRVEGTVVSSSAVRRTVLDGNMNLAARLLGRPFFITGEVVTGEGLGAKLGFPTANLSVPPEKLMPPDGVYVGRVILGGESWPAAVHAGERPTVGGSHSVEAHLLDYEGSLVGKRVKLELLHLIRDVERMQDESALATRIGRDVEIVRDYFAG